jgi:hypothetical protein
MLFYILLAHVQFVLLRSFSTIFIAVFVELLTKSESLGLRTLPLVWDTNKLENEAFQKLDLFPSTGKEREMPTLLSPLERANLNHWTLFWAL